MPRAGRDRIGRELRSGVIAGSRIVGLLGPYLVRWWWVIVALIWLSILWSAWTFVAPTRAARPAARRRSSRDRRALARRVRDGATGDVPLARESAAVAALTPDIEHALDPDRTYLLNWAETRTWSSVAVGVYLELHDAGFDVKVPPTFEHTWGSGRTALDHEVDEKVIVVADENHALGWEPPAGAVEIAHYDPLTQAQRARATQLDAELRAVLEPDERSAAIIPVENPLHAGEAARLGRRPGLSRRTRRTHRPRAGVHGVPRAGAGCGRASTTGGAGAPSRTAPASSA